MMCRVHVLYAKLQGCSRLHDKVVYMRPQVTLLGLQGLACMTSLVSLRLVCACPGASSADIRRCLAPTGADIVYPQACIARTCSLPCMHTWWCLSETHVLLTSDA